MSTPSVIVSKCNLQGEETWRYDGQVLHQEAHQIVIEAYFNHPDIHLLEILLQQGDRFIETFYTDRWYNVFEIHDRADGRLKGWYCNVACPAKIALNPSSGAPFGDSTPGWVISYVDLALDLFVYPDGHQVVLDEDEFFALALPDDLKRQALHGLAALQEAFTRRFQND